MLSLCDNYSVDQLQTIEKKTKTWAVETLKKVLKTLWAKEAVLVSNIFSIFHTCFQKFGFQGLLKLRIVW